MADALTAGNLGKFGQIALPIGLGVAAAAHPSLARAAGVVSNTMNTFQRNRRLREMKEMEEKRFGLSEKAAQRAEEEYEYNKSQRPVKEQRANILGTAQGPGGGIGAITVGPQGPQLQPLREGYGPEWQKGKDIEQGIKHEDWQYQDQLRRGLMQFETDLKEGRPPSPESALSFHTVIAGKKLTEKKTLIDEYDMDPKEADAYVEQKYRGALDYVNQFLPKGGIPQAPIETKPPMTGENRAALIKELRKRGLIK